MATSDHGTSVGEHERTGKSNINDRDERYWPLYPEISHVPFLIADEDIKKGRSLDLIAQPIDILPSLCELAGISVNPDQEFQGKSFAKALHNGTSVHRKYAVSGRHNRMEDGTIPRKATTPFLVTGRWGYAPVGANGKPELYDIVRDPLGENDIYEDNSFVVKKLHELFVIHLCDHGAADEFLSLWRGN